MYKKTLQKILTLYFKHRVKKIFKKHKQKTPIIKVKTK